MAKVHAFIPARQTSTRFPAKVLAVIGGESMLSRVCRRLGQCTRLDTGTVLVPAHPGNEALIGHCLIAKMPTYLDFETPEGDLLSAFYRTYQNSDIVGWDDYIVRVTADCPLIDPVTVDAVIDAAVRGEGFASNVHPARTFPDGLDVECFPVRMLAQWHQRYTDPEDRQHVTRGAYREEAGDVIPVTHEGEDLGDWRWTVDVEADLEWIQTLAAQGVIFEESARPEFAELVTFLKGKPDLVRTNPIPDAHVQ